VLLSVFEKGKKRTGTPFSSEGEGTLLLEGGEGKRPRGFIRLIHIKKGKKKERLAAYTITTAG